MSSTNFRSLSVNEGKAHSGQELSQSSQIVNTDISKTADSDHFMERLNINSAELVVEKARSLYTARFVHKLTHL